MLPQPHASPPFQRWSLDHNIMVNCYALLIPGIMDCVRVRAQRHTTYNREAITQSGADVGWIGALVQSHHIADSLQMIDAHRKMPPTVAWHTHTHSLHKYIRAHEPRTSVVERINKLLGPYFIQQLILCASHVYKYALANTINKTRNGDPFFYDLHSGLVYSSVSRLVWVWAGATTSRLHLSCVPQRWPYRHTKSDV